MRFILCIEKTGSDLFCQSKAIDEQFLWDYQQKIDHRLIDCFSDDQSPWIGYPRLKIIPFRPSVYYSLQSAEYFFC